ncbi:NYN domain-containing protein [candidate division WOR-3 bacterium]|nr:NYN domain-containing protein [candidate division WOR-3 bacterium]
MEKVAIFIDGSNFYHAMKDNLGQETTIDFRKFSEILVGSRELIRTYYYTSLLIKEINEEQYRAQQNFLDILKTLPYLKVKLGRLEKRPDGSIVEKGVDVTLAIDILKLAPTYNTAILVSGDGDFAYVLETVKDLGKHVEVAYFWSKFSHPTHLREACDKYIFLTKDYLKDCIKKG